MEKQPNEQVPVPKAYTIRRMLEADAAGVVELVRGVYGDGYYPPDLYEAERIVRLNREGQLVSVVALEAAGRVVGHYALERPHLGPVAEGSDAIVEMEHRHHHLLEDMRVLLRQAGLEAGLVGIVGYPVTNHVFSQKAEEHFGAHLCGVALGLWPASFHNMPEALPQRMSFVIYFKYLRPPGQVLHATTRHQDMCVRISDQFGIPVTAVEPRPATGTGQLAVIHETPMQAGTIRVQRIGADTVGEIRRHRRELCAAGAKAITLELPLAQPAAGEACRAAEEDGFFFCGLGPAFAADGDTLLLQYLAEPLDPALVQVDSPLARELLDYVVRDWRRVGTN